MTTVDIESEVDIVTATKLTRDLRHSAALMGREQARYIVDLYYALQEHRIATSNQSRALNKDGEPVELINWFTGQLKGLEASVPSVMKVWVEQSVPGRWLLSQHGIGPVIAAGLLAHLDNERAKSASAYWRFAGLDPTSKWAKNTRRPFNADLKVLCWKAGDSFVKQSGSEKCFYGYLYRQRKQLELERDAQGGHAEAAAKALVEKNIKDKALRATYESGHLPAGRLDLRARRYAVKMLLSHLWRVQYEVRTGQAPPDPYAIELLGHSHYIPAPGWPLAE